MEKKNIFQQFRIGYIIEIHDRFIEQIPGKNSVNVLVYNCMYW